ncbi:hypothetical protein SAMN05421681_10326 [Lysobacter enzymogenes]|nr:hypothetical protein SAMN05421681_10326 [Lysobacter enzymogenes]
MSGDLLVQKVGKASQLYIHIDFGQAYFATTDTLSSNQNLSSIDFCHAERFGNMC